MLDYSPSLTTSSPEARADLTAARKRAKLSQAALGRKLAEASGRPKAYSQTVISQWEKSDTSVPTDVLLTLDKVLPGWRSNVASPPASAPEPGPLYGDKFDRWCNIAAIDPDFPTLSRFRRRDESYASYRNESWDSALRVLSRTRPRAPLAIVSLADGHGVSTFVETLAADLQARIRSANEKPVPVVVHAEQILDDDADERLRRRLVRRISQIHRDGGLRDLAGALGSKASIYRVASLESPEIDSINWGEVAADGAKPLLATDDLVSLIQTLESQFALNSCFVVDASSSALDRTRRLRDPRDEIMSQLLDRLSDMSDRGVSAVVVGSRSLLRAADSDGPVSDRLLPNHKLFQLPAFEPGDYFRILIQQFGSHVELRVDGALLDGLTGEDMSLTRSGEALKLRLIEACMAPGGVPLRLAARP